MSELGYSWLSTAWYFGELANQIRDCVKISKSR